MNEINRHLAYFQRKEIKGIATCFNCEKNKEGEEWFIDLYKRVGKHKSFFCIDCLDKRTEYYLQQEKKGRDVIGRIKEGRRYKPKKEESIFNLSQNKKANRLEEKTSELERGRKNKNQPIKLRKTDVEPKKKSLKKKKELLERKQTEELGKSTKAVELEKVTKNELEKGQNKTQKLSKKVKALTDKLKKTKSQIVQLKKKDQTNLEKLKEFSGSKRTRSSLEINKIYNLNCSELFEWMKKNKGKSSWHF